MMAMTWIPVPVDEAQAFFRQRIFTTENPALPFEAKLFAALLLNTGELRRWSLADLVVHFGWDTRERCRWRTQEGKRTCDGWAAMSRVQRLLDEVKNPAKSWTLVASDGEWVKNDKQPTSSRVQMTSSRSENQELTGDPWVNNDKQPRAVANPRVRARGVDLLQIIDPRDQDQDLDQDLHEEKNHASAMRDSADASSSLSAAPSQRDLFKEMGNLLIARGQRSPWGMLQQLRTKYTNEYLEPAISSTLDETIEGPHGAVKSRLLFHLARLTKTKVSTVMNGGRRDSATSALSKKPTSKKAAPAAKHILEIDLEDCAKQGCRFCQARMNEADGELVYPAAGWMATEWIEEYGITSTKWNGR